MRNFNMFKEVVENAKDMIDNVYSIYLDKYRMVEVDNEDEDTSDIYNLLYDIRWKLEVIISNLCYDIKTVTDTVISLAEPMYNISSYVNDGIGGEELKDAIDAVDKIADRKFFYVDESVYNSMIIDERDRPEKDGNEIVIEDIWMDNVLKEDLDNIFYSLYKIGYLSRLHRATEEEDGSGVILDLAVYKDKADDLVEFLNVFTRYSYTNNIGEHDRGWDFRNVIRILSERMEEFKDSRKYKNFELTKFIYNSTMYRNSNPFRVLRGEEE